MLIGVEKEFFKRTIWLPSHQHASSERCWRTHQRSISPFPLSLLSLTLPTCHSFYLRDSLPDTPIPSHSLSDLNLVTDFCILSSSCVTKPSSLAAAYKVQTCSVSAHARLRTAHGVWQLSALETLTSQDCLSRGELCQAPSIHFNTCVSWRFQNGLITVSNCSGIPRETGRLDLERPREFREGSVHSGETTPPRELTRRVCCLPFPFDKLCLSDDCLWDDFSK